MLRLTVVLAILGVVLGAPSSGVPSGRILGGEPTNIEHHPYHLGLYSARRYICGAVLLAHNWAISTAHCVSGNRDLSIRAGSTNVNYGGQLVDVERVFLHQNYNYSTLDYNFALLSLAGSVAVQNAAPVLLPEPNYPVYVGDLAVITGWGQINEDGLYPEILYYTVVPVISFADCLRAYDGYILTERMFCAGEIGIGGRDASHGDRGGPVIINGRLAGLISWAIGHASPEFPGVYANIASVRGWIAGTAQL